MKIINRTLMQTVTQNLKPRFDLETMYKKYRKFLKNAKDGEVVTRFPPEPSGYLHIGHIKAVCLNFHYSKMYKGKMIMRFDDTNPTKEKDEFKESILSDLKTLDIVPDMHTHTSDHFAKIIDMCTWAIDNDLAYCDATPQEEMQKLRMEKQASAFRDISKEEHMKVWLGMIKGENKDYCVRAKIDYKSLNGCMRDPVIFRHNSDPHVMTGTKYKVYPTYDFACPIVDSEEGVTHAMRTNEYADRIPQYKWFLAKLKLRKVKIQEYSRLNFVKTTLSKRKLNWFVENGLVDGWDDPRFPTVQGILRRGMLINTIVEFMMEQGPSKNTNLMEWDKIWSLNRKNIDPIALRFTAVSKENAVTMTISNLEDENEVQMVALHPKNKEVGDKPVYRRSKVLIEKEDAETLEENGKLVLLKWGVFQITKLKNDKGEFDIQLDYLPDDKDFKNPPKVSWLPADPALHVSVNLTEYGHLLIDDKPKDNFEESVNKNSRKDTEYIGEAFLQTLQEEAIIQFERNCYARLDKKEVLENDKLRLNFILIPDGKTKKDTTKNPEPKKEGKKKSKAKKDDKKQPEPKKEDEKKN